MSVARGFGLNGKSFYSNIAKPMDINLTYKVDSSNGLGITSLKSNGYVNNVFMHTSTTPTANNGVTNPNPLAGFAIVQFKQNFNYFLSGVSGFISKNSGSDVKIDNSAMTAGQVYTITTLGNATAAKWTAIGVPAGVTPAVGVSFVAASNGGSGNVLTSKVQVPSVSGVSHMEVIGNPNVMIPANIASNAGQMVMLQFLKPSTAAVTSALTMDSYTPAGTNNSATPPIFTGTPAVLTGTIVNSGGATTMVVGAPADGSVVNMCFRFDGSSVTIDGI